RQLHRTDRAEDPDRHGPVQRRPDGHGPGDRERRGRHDQPQATADVLSAAEDLDGVTVDAADGATYEHVDFTFDNKGPFDPEAHGGDEEAAKKIRQAFLKTVPREDIVDKIIKPLDEDATTRDSFTQ